MAKGRDGEGPQSERMTDALRLRLCPQSVHLLCESLSQDSGRREDAEEEGEEEGWVAG